jgi:hypothetical protein
MSLTKQNLIDAFKAVESMSIEPSIVYMPAHTLAEIKKWDETFNREEAEKSNAVWIKDKEPC